MRKTRAWGAVLALLIGVAAPAMGQDKEQDRLEAAGQVMQDILNMPDTIPQELLDKAECIIVIPSVLKAAFIVGGSYGRGAMTCRQGQNFDGNWSAPAMYAVEGGSFGFQIGGEATDFVLLVMNEHGVKSLLSTKVKLGAGVSAAAGPVGRTAEAATDVALRAEILTYSRARGLFAGISLEGSTLRPDGGANQNLYGREIGARAIVHENAVPVPPTAKRLIELLDQKTPKRAK